MYRIILLDNFFSKAFICNLSKSDITSVFLWVPTGTYININYEQDLIGSPIDGDLHKPFAAAFMLDHMPNDVDLSLCNEREEYYVRVRNSV